ncbi:hypothetical protein AWN76_013455 [Rhodothermaceae bacterium RA]|nr:hypothetical protein AWN76_013455 [Rhodothermaceae bacterium RA]
MSLRAVLFALLFPLLTTAYAQDFTVVGTTPAVGDSSVALQATVRFTFSAPLDTTARFGEQGPLAFFTISPPDSIQIDSVTYSADLTEARFHVRQTDETDVVWILTGAQDQEGRRLVLPEVLRYSTAPTWGPGRVTGEAVVYVAVKHGPWPSPYLLALLPAPPAPDTPQQGMLDVTAAQRLDWDLDSGYMPFDITGMRLGTYWPVLLYDFNRDGLIQPEWRSSLDLKGEGIYFGVFGTGAQAVTLTADMSHASFEFEASISALEPAAELPGVAALLPNYPNPFNPATTLPFRLEHPARLRLTVHDLLGRRMATVAEGFYLPGDHAATWNAEALPSGFYMVRLESEAFVLTRRVLLVK